MNLRLLALKMIFGWRASLVNQAIEAIEDPTLSEAGKIGAITQVIRSWHNRPK